MRNDHIKYCDKRGIRDGLLREFLFKNCTDAAVARINQLYVHHGNQIRYLEELQKQLRGSQKTVGPATTEQGQQFESQRE